MITIPWEVQMAVFVHITDMFQYHGDQKLVSKTALIVVYSEKL